MANLIRKEVTFESSIAAIGAAMSDISRVKILSALMDGRAWTATELSSVANISASTASSHLSKLLDCQLITVVAQGKHRYFRLAGKDIAELMESMMGISLNHGVHARVSTPVHLRKARTCYDHLAGEVAVKIYDSLCQQQWITENGSMITLSGIQYFHEMG
ncbi:transcriptional regulator, partial [Salmonella enterica subsp. enterica serovar Typhimurium]|nr:transcriptional regulator [Salmonella enterica subsp. enterica serovar Typhimurium]